jgi:hypothetical protein
MCPLTNVRLCAIIRPVMARRRSQAKSVSELIEAYQRQYGRFALDYASNMEAAYRMRRYRLGSNGWTTC